MEHMPNFYDYEPPLVPTVMKARRELEKLASEAAERYRLSRTEMSAILCELAMRQSWRQWRESNF
jgi:hypothetical protein